jgi:hypothetical protein
VLNWHKYNESLVRCGEILLLDFDVVIDNWHSDLNGMNNEGKEGRKELMLTKSRFIHSFIHSTSWLYESLFSSSTIIQAN